MNFHSKGRPVVLKLKEALGDCIEIVEVIRCQDLPLDDRKVDLDLIEPTGMDGSLSAPVQKSP